MVALALIRKAAKWGSVLKIYNRAEQYNGKVQLTPSIDNRFLFEVKLPLPVNHR